MKFFECEMCGNLVSVIRDSGVSMVCCDQDMTELVPGTTDGAAEKHVPVCKLDGDKVVVTVGSSEHPMTDSHYIEWIVLETTGGTQRKMLHPGEKPCAEFALTGKEAVLSVYAYCNLHGLWMCEHAQC